MNTIHMDIEAMQRIKDRLIEIQGQIQNKATPLRRNYQGLPYHWIANSADEYFEYYTEFEGNIARIVERLGNIASELSNEIDRWESMDNGLSR